MGSKLQTGIFLATIFLLIALGALLQTNSEVLEAMEQFEEFLQDKSLAGMGVYILLSAGITAFAIPFSFVDIACAYVYDAPLNMVLMFIAKTLGSICCYLIGNECLSRNTKRQFLSQKYLRKMNALVKSAPIYYGTMVRFASVPTSIKNYGLALMDIDFSNYILCCVIGSLVFVPLQASMGESVKQVIEHIKDGTTPEFDATQIFSIASLVVLLYLVKKIAQQKIEEADQPAEEKEHAHSQ